MEYLILVIDSNTLARLALCTLLSDLVPFARIVSCASVAEATLVSGHIVHYFVSEECALADKAYFQERQPQVMVLSGSTLHPVLQGFRSLDITQPEADLVRALLSIHQMGHAPAVHPHPPVPFSSADAVEPLLSQRERDVLALVVKGQLNKEIADTLHIGITTVITHRQNITTKLGTRSIGRLALYAVRTGVVDLEELSLDLPST